MTDRIRAKTPADMPSPPPAPVASALQTEADGMESGAAFDHAKGRYLTRGEQEAAAKAGKVPATRFIDLTPAWAGIMPALVACIAHGTPEGRAMAEAELNRLARLVDKQNDAGKAEEAEAAEERNAFGLASVALGRERAAVDLARAASDFALSGRHDRAACYYAAAGHIAPAGQSADFVSAGDVQELLAAHAHVAALDKAKAEALPEAQEARARAIAAARAAGRSEGLEEARKAEGATFRQAKSRAMGLIETALASRPLAHEEPRLNSALSAEELAALLSDLARLVADMVLPPVAKAPGKGPAL